MRADGKRVSVALAGLSAGAVLVGVYFLILTLVSGWSFAQGQFQSFWYFVVGLALGFGIQVSLYVYLRHLVASGHRCGAALGATGAASTIAMLSCCTHYLVNLLPLLGVTGIVTFAAQYQVEFFWIGLVANVAGIIYMRRKIMQLKQKT